METYITSVNPANQITHHIMPRVFAIDAIIGAKDIGELTSEGININFANPVNHLLISIIHTASV